MPDFLDVVVSAAWWKPISTYCLRRLHIKLARTAKALKKWHRASFGNIGMHMAVASEIIGRLDVATGLYCSYRGDLTPCRTPSYNLFAKI